MSKKLTKKLAICLLTMVMLLSVVVGGTYAYFTDSVSIKDNVITAGSIAVDANLYVEGATDGTYDVEVSKIEMNNVAPGDSKTYMLSVENVGSLNAMYKVLVSATQTDLAEVLTITYTVGKTTANLDLTADIFATDWAQIDATEPNTAVEMFITIEMNSGAGSSYEFKSFAFDIDVLATQVGVETTGIVLADEVADITAATAGQTVMLITDITEDVAVELTDAVNFDLNGKTLTVASFKMETNEVATADLANGTIITETGNIELLLPNGTVNVTDVTLGTDGEVILNASTNTINLVGAVKFMDKALTTDVTAKILADSRVVINTTEVVKLVAPDGNVTTKYDGSNSEDELTDEEVSFPVGTMVANEEELLAAANNGEKVILANNVEITDNKAIALVFMHKGFDADLNGFTLDVTANTYSLVVGEGLSATIENGDLNIVNGTKISTSVIQLKTNTTVTLDNVNYTTDGAAIYVTGPNATVNVTNSTVNAPVYCVATNGSDSEKVTMNCENSTFTATHEAGIPLFLNCEGTFNITNCVANTLHTGLLVRGGTANVDGLTINYDASITSVEDLTDLCGEYWDGAWRTGTAVPSAPIVLGNRVATGYYGTTVADLAGIEVNNYPRAGVAVYAWGYEANDASLTLNYDESLTAENVLLNGANVYVNGVHAVANETQLLAALATGYDIVLSNDITLTSALTIDNTVSIYGGGHTITSNGILLVSASNVVIDGTNFVFPTTTDYGLMVGFGAGKYSKDGTMIENFTIKNSSVKIGGGYSALYIGDYGYTGEFVVDNCTFDGGAVAMHSNLLNDVNFTVTNNTICNTANNASMSNYFYTYSTKGTSIENVTVEFNNNAMSGKCEKKGTWTSSGIENHFGIGGFCYNENVTFSAAGNTVALSCVEELNSIDANKANTTYIVGEEEVEFELILAADIAADVVIPADTTVTLNLNGYTLTSVASHAIANNGTLTIEGEGTVLATIDGKAALMNNIGATATINAGTLTRDGVSKWYTIKNEGTLTINGGKVTNPDLSSSNIANGWNGATAGNVATLTINGGLIDGGLNALKNDEGGVATINGGKFTNQAQHVVYNWNLLTINGGEFIATGDDNTICNGGYNDFAVGTLTVGANFDVTSITFEHYIVYGNSTVYVATQAQLDHLNANAIVCGNAGKVTVTIAE